MIGHSPVGGAEGGGSLNDVLWSVIQASQLANEIMNFPSLEGADGTQPEWWAEGDGNATLTEEDVAGEGITENYLRCLKVVTIADAKYAFQRHAYPVQPRVKVGKLLSAIVAVWSVGGVAARVRLQSSVGSLGVSADTVAAGWTILTVEGVTLDGAFVDLRLEVDSGTAYFVPLGMGIGVRAVPLAPRGLRYRWPDTETTIKTLTGIGDEDTWTDIDCTATTSALAALAVIHANMWEPDAADIFELAFRRNGDGGAGHDVGRVQGTPLAPRLFADKITILDDSQIFEYKLDRAAGADTLDYGIITLIGWWEWE